MRKLKCTTGCPSLYPFLFAVYSILFLYEKNINFVKPIELLIPSILIISFLLAVQFVLNRIFKDANKRAFISFLLVLLFFTFGHFYEFIDRYEFFMPFAGSTLLLASLYIMFVGLLISLTARTKKDLTFLRKPLSIASVFLIIFISIQIAWMKATIPEEIAHSKGQTSEKAAVQSYLKATNELPDIYYIILDGYTGFGVLKNFFGFDNLDFYRFLVANDFYVADQSKANYIETHLSITSSLNMGYIHKNYDKTGRLKAIGNLSPKINDSKVFKILKENGYKIINYNSGYSVTKKISGADFNFDIVTPPNEFFSILKRTSLLRLFYLRELGLERVIKFWPEQYKRRLIPKVFDAIAKAKDANSPKFVLAHFISPHPPFQFDPSGGKPSDIKESLLDWDSKEKFLGEIQYINGKISNLVRDLLSSGRKKPIIIIQGDHGSLFNDSKEASLRMIERGYILNAYRLPDKCTKSLYRSISPVNSFRLIFNCLFGSNLEMLKDEIWFHQDPGFKTFIDKEEDFRSNLAIQAAIFHPELKKLF
jgi:hypothetical protein